MYRPSVLVVLTGCILAAGLGLSAWGNQVLLEELSSESRILETGESMNVSVEMESGSGVFVIDAPDHDGTVRITIRGPLGDTITDEAAPRGVYEGYFVADVAGEYVLDVQNGGAQKGITALVGPEPDKGKRTLLFISTYVIIIGLGGMAVSITYAVRKR